MTAFSLAGTTLVPHWYYSGLVLQLGWYCADNVFHCVLQLRAADGVLVPGGFGNRGVEGKILAAQYARENKVPYLGICLGMQVRAAARFSTPLSCLHACSKALLAAVDSASNVQCPYCQGRQQR